MVNFYRHVLQGAAQVLKPLTDSLRGGTKGKLEWTEAIRTAFEQSKTAMLIAAELAHPVEGAEISLEFGCQWYICGGSSASADGQRQAAS